MSTALELRIQLALLELVKRPEAPGLPFLIITHTPTKRFVQFAGSTTKPLYFDVPALQIGREVKESENPAELAVVTLCGLIGGGALNDADVVLTDERTERQKAAQAQSLLDAVIADAFVSPPTPVFKDPYSPQYPCQCGGKYTLARDEQGEPMVTHTMPFCDRFMALDDTADAVRFSEENRARFEN